MEKIPNYKLYKMKILKWQWSFFRSPLSDHVFDNFVVFIIVCKTKKQYFVKLCLQITDHDDVNHDLVPGIKISNAQQLLTALSLKPANSSRKKRLSNYKRWNWIFIYGLILLQNLAFRFKTKPPDSVVEIFSFQNFITGKIWVKILMQELTKL